MSEINRRRFLGVAATSVGVGVGASLVGGCGSSCPTVEPIPDDRETIEEPVRQTPVLASTDVLVLGGGPAGLSAALAVAREGARTTLVERYGCCGGVSP